MAAGHVAPLGKMTATSAPGVTNDIHEGYSVGSRWVNVNVSPRRYYVCTDASFGVATWARIDTSLDPVVGSIQGEPTGFPNRTDSTLSLSTRTFTIAPSNGSFDYYINSLKYTVTASDAITITDASGIHAIYYDGATLSETVDPSEDAYDDLMLTKALVALVYWNATDGAAYITADERHGTNMSGRTHEWIHDAIGAVWSSGLTISGYTEDEEDADASLTFEVTDGEFYDEDLGHDIEDGTAANQYEQQLNGGDAEIPVMYRDDVDGSWTQDAASALPYKVGGSGRMAYNKDDGDGTYSQVEVTDGKWVSVTFVATNDWAYPVKAIQGQNEYATKATAVEEASAEVIAWGDMPTAEFVVLYRFVMQTKDSYGSTPNAQIVDVTDFRRSGLTGASAASQDHGTLGGLGDDDHAQYILDADFTAADEIMVGTGAGTHNQVTLAASEFLAKKAAGAATNVSAAEARTILGLVIGTDVLAEQTIGIADDNLLEVDDADAADNDYAKFTANGLEGRSYAEVKQDLDLEIGTDVLAEQTIGIADDNLLEVDDADAADNDYAKFTANGLEGRSVAEVLSDIGAAADADLTTHMADTTTHGTSGAIVGISDTQTLTNKTITSAKCNELLDTNGNESVILTATASAVNELTIANAASGDATTGPTIAATGSATNLAVTLTHKGAAYTVLGNSASGAVRAERAFSVFRDGANASFNVRTYHSSSAGQASINLMHGGGTEASPSNVGANWALGGFGSAGYYNSGWRFGARIDFEVDGSPSGSVVPQKITFQTNSAGTLYDRLVIYGAGTTRVVGTNHLEFNGATTYISSPSSSALEIRGGAELKLYSNSAVRMEMDNTGIGFFNVSPVARPDIVGARDVPEEALADLLTKLALLGLVTDSTTAS